MTMVAKPVRTDSVVATVDAINDAHYARIPLSAADRAAAARFIAGRQGLPGSYSGMFAGVGSEAKGIRLYTGERITSASARHILGEECCRALRLLKVKDAQVSAALSSAESGLSEALDRAERHPRFINIGLFCCGKCSVGLWRNAVSGGLDRREKRLTLGVRHLKTARKGDGEWRKFPFWYTVLALADIDSREARAELAYARPHIERILNAPARGESARRRRLLAERCF